MCYTCLTKELKCLHLDEHKCILWISCILYSTSVMCITTCQFTEFWQQGLVIEANLGNNIRGLTWGPSCFQSCWCLLSDNVNGMEVGTKLSYRKRLLPHHHLGIYSSKKVQERTKSTSSSTGAVLLFFSKMITSLCTTFLQMHALRNNEYVTSAVINILVSSFTWWSRYSLFDKSLGDKGEMNWF